MAKKIKMVTLFNCALNERGEYRMVNVNEELLTRSKAEGGSDAMKKLVRKAIKDLLNGDILDCFDGQDVTRQDVDYCIDELAKGHASNIAGEAFYWGDTEEIVMEF